MISTTNIIKLAYEDEGMSPEAIAIDQGLETEAVKGALMQYSAKYRTDCGQETEIEDGLNFSKDELRRVNRVILDLALGAEDEHLRGKMATYVRDDVKGRKEVVKLQQGSNTNIFNFNQRILEVREAAARLAGGTNIKKAISI